MQKLTPNPGSPEAKLEGCRCPRIDNHNGRGYHGQAGVFVIDERCPIHAEVFHDVHDPRRPEV